MPLPPWAVRAGARKDIYYNPAEVNVAIVTCGGLCPGLNDVVQGLVRKLEDYGVPEGNILGIKCAPCWAAAGVQACLMRIAQKAAAHFRACHWPALPLSSLSLLGAVACIIRDVRSASREPDCSVQSWLIVFRKCEPGI